MYAMNIYCFTFSGQLSLEISILSYIFVLFEIGTENTIIIEVHSCWCGKIWTKDGILMNRNIHVKIFNMLSWWMWFDWYALMNSKWNRFVWKILYLLKFLLQYCGFSTLKYRMASKLTSIFYFFFWSSQVNGVFCSTKI